MHFEWPGGLRLPRIYFEWPGGSKHPSVPGEASSPLAALGSRIRKTCLCFRRKPLWRRRRRHKDLLGALKRAKRLGGKRGQAWVVCGKLERRDGSLERCEEASLEKVFNAASTCGLSPRALSIVGSFVGVGVSCQMPASIIVSASSRIFTSGRARAPFLMTKACVGFEALLAPLQHFEKKEVIGGSLQGLCSFFEFVGENLVFHCFYTPEHMIVVNF